MTTLQTIEHLIEKLPINQKIVLARKLEKDTAQNKMVSILKRINERIKKYPINEKEVSVEVKAIRKKLYAKYYHWHKYHHLRLAGQ